METDDFITLSRDFVPAPIREGTTCSMTTIEYLERQHTMNLGRDIVRSKAPPLPVGKEYHVFFCFHGGLPDREWTKAVVREIEHLGYKCCVYERDFDIGRSLMANIKNSFEKSMRTIVVLSSAYINNEWRQLELEAMSFGVDGISFVPVLIEPCGIPPFLKYYKYINATGGKDRWWNELVDTLRGTAPALPSRKKYHVFIAHGMNDTPWVSKIVKTLESSEHGLICCYPARNFKPGSPIVENIEFAIKRSVKMIIVMSSSFANGDWKRHYEGRLRGRRPIPVIIEDDFAVPPSIEDIVCINATVDEDLWFPAFLSALKDDDQSLCDDTVSSSCQSIPVSRETASQTRLM